MKPELKIIGSIMVKEGDVSREGCGKPIGDIINRRVSHEFRIKNILVPEPTKSSQLGKGRSFDPEHFNSLTDPPGLAICLSASACLHSYQSVF